MASIISATTTSGLVNTADNSGDLQFQTQNGANTITLPNSSGTLATTANLSGLGFKNRVINGAMVIAQRGTSAVTTDASFPVDRFQLQVVNANLSAVQSSTAPAGFNFSTAITVTSTTSSGSNDRSSLFQFIEGFNTADLGFGTANAKTVSVSFWARSTVAGTYSGNLSNAGGTRTYIFTYTLAANTWTYVTATIAGDTGGTWVGATNAIGLAVRPIMLNCGSSFQGTAGSWIAGDARGTSGSTYLATTNSGAVVNITGVQLEVGSTATSFDYRPYGTELQLCQRYYQTYPGIGNGNRAIWSGYGAVANYAYWIFKTSMRTSPTIAGATLGTVDPSSPEAVGVYSTGSNYAAFGYNGSSYGQATATAEL